MQKAAGVNHVGFGVRNLEVARKFYQETLDFTFIWDQWDYSINTMADAFRNSPHNFLGYMFRQKIGGLLLEPILKKYPTPRAIRKKVCYGDLGVNKITIAVADVKEFYGAYRDKIVFFSEPKSTVLPGIGDYSFVYGQDPDGNLLEFASWEGANVKEGIFGGALSVGISVSDLERTKQFYQQHCDFDVVVSEHECFSGLVGEMTGNENTKVKSCLLDCSKRKHGGMLELYEVSNPRGRSIPFGSEWGDFGYMEICLNSLWNAIDLQKYYLEKGVDVVQRPTKFSESPNGVYQYWFLYALDPDGVFVEHGSAHKVK